MSDPSASRSSSASAYMRLQPLPINQIFIKGVSGLQGYRVVQDHQSILQGVHSTEYAGLNGRGNDIISIYVFFLTSAVFLLEHKKHTSSFWAAFPFVCNVLSIDAVSQ